MARERDGLAFEMGLIPDLKQYKTQIYGAMQKRGFVKAAYCVYYGLVLQDRNLRRDIISSC